MQPGSGASITKATGRSPRIGLGAGQPPEFLPKIHIRTQEEVGPVQSWGGELGARNPG